MYNYSTGHALEAQWGPRAAHCACPNGVLLGVQADTGLPRVEPCRKNACLTCARSKVRQVERAIRFTQPSALVTFTLLGQCHRSNALCMNNVARNLRRGKGALDLAWVWATEPNPNDTGAHAHAWLRGDVPSIEALQQQATQVGFGICDIRPATHHGNLGYLCKTATWNQRSLEAYRGLNGNELIHGQFWRDPHTGEHLSRREAATRQWALDNPYEAQRYGR